MPRNPNNEFKEKLKNYIKSEWMKHGQKTFSIPIGEITVDIFGEDKSTHRNMIWRYLPALEKSGFIKVDKGNQKGNPNWYTWLNDNIVEQISEQREECIETMEDFIKDYNDLGQRAVNIQSDLTQKLTSALGELNHYKQAFLDLELYGGPGPDGKQIIMAKKESNIGSIITQVKKEYEKKEQQEQTQEEKDNTTNQ